MRVLLQRCEMLRSYLLPRYFPRLPFVTSIDIYTYNTYTNTYLVHNYGTLSRVPYPYFGCSESFWWDFPSNNCTQKKTNNENTCKRPSKGLKWKPANIFHPSLVMYHGEGYIEITSYPVWSRLTSDASKSSNPIPQVVIFAKTKGWKKRRFFCTRTRHEFWSSFTAVHRCQVLVLFQEIEDVVHRPAQ